MWQRAIRPAQIRSAYAPRGSFLLREHGGMLCLGENLVSDSISQKSENLASDSISQKSENQVSDSISQKSENLVSDCISQKSENLLSDSISLYECLYACSLHVPATKYNPMAFHAHLCIFSV